MNNIYWRRNLKFLRDKKGVDQAQLGIYVDKTQRTISNWENGISQPNIEEVALITQFFGISVDDFYFEDLTGGKVIENEKNSLKGKVKGKVMGKVTSNDGDFSELERLKQDLAVKEAFLASKDEIIASLRQNNEDLRTTLSILNDEILRLKRAISELERHVDPHSGRSGHAKTA